MTDETFFPLEGVEAPAAAFHEALARGRLHHAWLLTGPEGAGKASFAHRAARLLLGARPDPAYGPLGSSPEDPVNRLLAAGAHPDILAVDRRGEDGKLRKTIAVDDIRRLPDMFAKAPALAPYRVAIIDAADDLGPGAANALLKTLEEPPPRGILFVISHAPGRLLPTIRSRCRRLAFPAWPEPKLAGWLERRGVGADIAFRLAELAAGAPGRALKLWEEDAASVDAAARALLMQAPGLDRALAAQASDSFRDPGRGQARFDLWVECLCDQVRRAVAADPPLADGGLERWSAVWTRLMNLPGETAGLNLDRADAFSVLLAEIVAAARQRPFAELASMPLALG